MRFCVKKLRFLFCSVFYTLSRCRSGGERELKSTQKYCVLFDLFKYKPSLPCATVTFSNGKTKSGSNDDAAAPAVAADAAAAIVGYFLFTNVSTLRSHFFAYFKVPYHVVEIRCSKRT